LPKSTRGSEVRWSAADLFAGAGGLSEGFYEAGFNIISSVEMDYWACETLRTRAAFRALKKNGLGRRYVDLLKGDASREDVLRDREEMAQEVEASVIKEEMSDATMHRIIAKLASAIHASGQGKLHVLLGGPPCQPYSIAGRGRDAARMRNDGRHFLYRHYLRTIEALEPDFFLFENVPGLLSARADGAVVFEKMINDFRKLKPSYDVAPSLRELSNNPRAYILDSSHFAVPQRRLRVFIVGYRDGLRKRHPGIENVFARIQRYANRSRGVLTVADAIGDLPRLQSGEGSDRWFGSYTDSGDVTTYARWARKGSPGIVNHRARPHMEEDLERYRYFIEKHKNGKRFVTLDDLIEERPDLIPRHRHLDKFLDRFHVQWWERPSSTITAHIHKDGHHYIHPDISQCRSFTVREAARCQSFPDNYVFEGPRTQQFLQVGNAVPPRLAATIGKFIKKELEAIYG